MKQEAFRRAMRRTLRAPKKEVKAEEAFTRSAKELGCLVRKMNGLGYRDWPDRLVVTPEGLVLWVEFKRAGQDLRPSQQNLREELELRRQPYLLAYSAAQALDWLRGHLSPTSRARTKKKRSAST